VVANSVMTLHFNKTSQKEKRRFLRSHLPKPEAILWKHLSRRQMLGYKFRRQYSVDQFVMDFYCPELKLAVEVDGDTHFIGKAPEYDNARQLYIESFGIRFVRVRNADVCDSLESVLFEIQSAIERLNHDRSIN
jgi:very-short-patch-repair endonuclease